MDLHFIFQGPLQELAWVHISLANHEWNVSGDPPRRLWGPGERQAPRSAIIGNLAAEHPVKRGDRRGVGGPPRAGTDVPTALAR